LQPRFSNPGAEQSNEKVKADKIGIISLRFPVSDQAEVPSSFQMAQDVASKIAYLTVLNLYIRRIFRAEYKIIQARRPISKNWTADRNVLAKYIFIQIGDEFSHLNCPKCLFSLTSIFNPEEFTYPNHT
jgi:hypothetical protein